MATVASLNVILSLDDRMTGGLASAQNKLRSFGQTATNIGRSLTTSLTLPFTAAVGYSIKAASDLNEAIDKTTVVFGDAASAVMAWSADSSTAMGLSQSNALEYASTLGNLFVAMGFTNNEAADFSQRLTVLAVDLASLNNTGVEESLIAIRAAIVGEFEPMRRFGVVMSEASIQAKALELGLWNGVGVMDAQTRALVIMHMMYEQTGTAQGNFALTSGETANQMKIARASFDDAAAALGQVLLPYVIKALGAFTDLMRAIEKLPAPVQKAVVIIGLFAAGIGPLLIAVGLMATGLAALIPVLTAVGGAFVTLGTIMMANPITLVILAIAAAIAALYVAYQANFLGFRDGVQWGMEKVRQVVMALRVAVDRLKDAWDTFWAALQVIAAGVKAKIVAVIQPAIDIVNGLIDQLNRIPGVDIPKIGGLDQITEDATNAKAAVVDLQTAMTSMMTQGIMFDTNKGNAALGGSNYADPYRPSEGGNAFVEFRKFDGSVFTEIAAKANDLSTAVDTTRGKLGELANTDTSAWAASTTGSITTVRQGFAGNLDPSVATSKNALVTFGSVTTASINGWSGNIRSSVNTTATTLRSQAQNATSAARVAFTQFTTTSSASVNAWAANIASQMSRVTSAITSGMAQSTAAVRAAASQWPGIIAAQGGAAASIAFSIGANIGNAFAAGMRSALGAINAAAAQMVSAADTALRAKAMISSPSRLFAQLGEYVGEGFEDGIRSTIPGVARATGDLVNVPGVDRSGVNGANGGQVIQIITLEPGKWKEFLANAEAGGQFARQFGGELAMMGGTP